MKSKKQIPSSKQKKKVSSAGGAKKSTNRNYYYLGLGIILLVSCLAYLPVLHNEFLIWDDIPYIRDNPLIYSFNLGEIFTKNVMGNYHPLTILALATEYHLFGLSETGFHAVNLLIHLFNVALVSYAIWLLAGRMEVALIAALLFGVHPLHVESVAWAAELKDLLYTFFFLGSYIFYLRFVKAQENKFYLISILLFTASLLSKGMAASLPVVLVLTDFLRGRKPDLKMWMEKIPFFVLSIVFGLVSIAAQKAPDIVQDITFFTFPQRLVFACYSFITYLLRFLAPVQLSAYYPYPSKVNGGIPFSYYIYVIAFLALVASVIYSLRVTKKLVFGLGFFAITVFLVLQLLPVGDAIMADRYSYVPTIGLCYLAGEGLFSLWDKNYKTWVAILIIGLTGFFVTLTYLRSQVWKNDFSLWDDTIHKYQTIPLAYYNRGLAYSNRNENEKAVLDYTKAIELKPTYKEAYVNRANIFRSQNRNEEALSDYNKALDIKPNFSIALFNRGILFMNQNRNEEAIGEFTRAIEINPGYFKAYCNRGVLYVNEKKYNEAIQDYNTAIELNPDYMEAYYNRGIAHYYMGDKDQCCRDLQSAADLGFQKAVESIVQLCN
jgi:Tfp pilus assembly protein PilF